MFYYLYSHTKELKKEGSGKGWRRARRIQKGRDGGDWLSDFLFLHNDAVFDTKVSKHKERQTDRKRNRKGDRKKKTRRHRQTERGRETERERGETDRDRQRGRDK